jgi:hypothetical protein
MACELFAAALRRFGTQELKAGGRSMLPAIWPGDRLSIRSTDPSHIAAGDIVAFRRHAAIVVHRVVGILAAPSGTSLITRGDGLRTADPPVPASALLGRVVAQARGPFRLDPAAPVPRRWRLASTIVEWLRGCRTGLSLWRHCLRAQINGAHAYGLSRCSR